LEEKKFVTRFKQALSFPIAFVVLIWGIHLINYLSGYQLYQFGIYPRKTEGLWGVLTGPLVHGDWLHLFSNTLSFLILSFMLFFFFRKVAVQAFSLIYLLTGFAVWIFARESFHIGASGVVYGLVSFVFWSGIFRRNIKSIVLALIVTVLYSGYFLGIVPGEEGISWESHLLGGLVGILVAFIYRRDLEADEIERREALADSDLELQDKNFYFPPDVFDKKDDNDNQSSTGHGGFRW